MPAPIVVFDLDGTLVDTAPDLVSTLNAILVEAALPPIAFNQVRNMIGGGVRPLLERALASEGLTLPQARIEQMLARFLDRYAARIAEQSRPFPGAEDALNTLAERGFLLAICTNKLEWLSRKLLDSLSLTRFFTAICGQDTFGVKKPDPLIWQKTLLQAGGDATQAVMIGDSAIDIALARAAGVPVIAVDFGYSEIPIAQLGPDRLISHYNDLPKVLTEVLPKSHDLPLCPPSF